MIAAVGKGWYEDFKSCTDKFVVFGNTFYPAQKQAEKYKKFMNYMDEYIRQQRVSTGSINKDKLKGKRCVH
ncbi:MAG: hypothetical protein LBD98_05270 [Endomicrobium sp.]|jgi:hypothetical protein|nr:hypothetical protein [Endomicrobium sp.]